MTPAKLPLDTVLPATSEQIDRHNYHWNLPLHCFRRVFYTRDGERVEHDVQPSVDLLEDEIRLILESGGNKIAIYNSLTGKLA